ncbi:MAG: hypothetical protein JW860_03270 [Sedimentisphaerales bacterium]|nr:hypothetical protein [Sedimentisphaerales bacterium]
MNRLNNFQQNRHNQSDDITRQARLSQIEKKIENTTQTTRRFRLIRMLIIPVIFSLALILLSLVGHDMFVKKEYYIFMEKVSQNITGYVKNNHQLPSQEIFLQFHIKARNLSLDKLHYDSSFILPESPPDTILAYTPTHDFWMISPGHVVLYMDGKLEWIKEEQLKTLLKKRDQFYNSAIIH